MSRAHAMVANAIKTGRLVRGLCEDCGGCPVEAHHEDYDKPLDVMWLCRDCHLRRHGKETREPEIDVSAGRALRERRDAAMLTQRELADVLGVSWRAIQNWERGMRPAARHRRVLAEWWAEEQAA